MRPQVCVLLLLLLLLGSHRLRGCPPSSAPDAPRRQVQASPPPAAPGPSRPPSARLPGLCGRLRRRRITVLCHLQRFCWRGRGLHAQAGQVCRCPPRSRCSRVFVHSL